MMALEDINLGAMGLDDMSRISMGAADNTMNADPRKNDLQPRRLEQPQTIIEREEPEAVVQQQV